MSQTRENPLSRFRRSVATTVKLPTGGAFFSKPPTLDLNGDFAVYPMTGEDEILMKSQDALMNGEAIFQLIQSCVPGIPDPYEVSMADIDPLLIAIRAASNGNTFELSHECPKCKTSNAYDCDIPTLLSTIKLIDAEQTVRIDPTTVAYLKPLTYRDATKVMLEAVRTIQKQRSLDPDGPPEILEKFSNDALKRQARIDTETTASSIVKVALIDQDVTEPEFIFDFVKNAPRQITSDIKAKIETLSDSGINKTQKVTCSNIECSEVSEAELAFDPTNFFD